MPIDKSQRITRRRSSAGPVPPRRPLPLGQDRQQGYRQVHDRFSHARDHGKVFVADMPTFRMGNWLHRQGSPGGLESLERRIQDMEQELSHGPQGRHPVKASTKRDVTRRFIRAIQDEQGIARTTPL